jgi:4-hydroxybenzoate polyprenyltransferase
MPVSSSSHETNPGAWPALWAALVADPLPIGGIAVGVLLGTSALLEIPVSGPLLVAGFCGTVLVYLVDRVRVSPSDLRNCPARVAWIRNHTGWVGAEALLCGAVGGTALVLLAPRTLLVVGGLAAGAGGHVLLTDRDAEGLLRGFRKPLVVATTWTVGAVVLPVVEAGGLWREGLLWLLLYRGGLILANVLLSDWGDWQGEAAVGGRPWGRRWTARSVRWLATGCVGGSALAAVGLAVTGTPLLLLAVEALGLVGGAAAIWIVDPTEKRHIVLLDLLVGWPALTALASWGLG